VSADRDEYLDDDERGRFSPRRILASGWFRALLVLGALAIVLAVALPHILRWLDGTPSADRSRARVTTAPALTPSPAPTPGPTPVPPAARAAPTPPGPPVASRKTELIQPVPPTERPSPAATQAKPRHDGASSAAASKARDIGERGKAAAGARAREASPATTAGTGSYWVQVGAFQDARNAERLAGALRQQKVQVQVAEVSRSSSGGPARHEVVVSGTSMEAVIAALAGSGTAEQAGGAVVVRPALELRDAVALARRLAAEGLAVKIRRTGEGAPLTQYLVRVGGYPTRAAAVAGRREMESRGLPAFVTQGPPR